MVDRIRYPTVSYLPFYYIFFQFLLLTIFNLQANILTTKDILSNLATNHVFLAIARDTYTIIKKTILFYIIIKRDIKVQTPACYATRKAETTR